MSFILREQCSLWACVVNILVVICLHDAGVTAVSESSESPSGLPGFLSVSMPLNNTRQQRKAAWMLLESVGDVLEQNAKDAEFDPEPSLKTLSNAMKTQILQNKKGLGLEEHASDSYGDEDADSYDDEDADSYGDKELVDHNSSGLIPSSFAEEQEAEEADLGNCANKKMCFFCHGGSYNMAFYVSFAHMKVRIPGRKHSKCSFHKVFKIMRGAPESNVPLTGPFAKKHECRTRLEQHNARQSLKPFHVNRMQEIVEELELGADMTVPECQPACKMGPADKNKYAFQFNNDPNIAKGYRLTMRQCENMIPAHMGSASAICQRWICSMVVALAVFLSF